MLGCLGNGERDVVGRRRTGDFDRGTMRHDLTIWHDHHVIDGCLRDVLRGARLRMRCEAFAIAYAAHGAQHANSVVGRGHCCLLHLGSGWGRHLAALALVQGADSELGAFLGQRSASVSAAQQARGGSKRQAAERDLSQFRFHDFYFPMRLFVHDVLHRKQPAVQHPGLTSKCRLHRHREE